MKKIILIILMTFPVHLFAQAKLDKLLEDRRSLHQEWQNAERKKSGIFGNRTKKDMIETNNWTERIIQKDDQIMEELYLLRDIEKTEITYEKNDYKFITQKQEKQIATLKRALLEKDAEIGIKKTDKRAYEWTTLIFFLSTLTLGYLYWNKSKPKLVS